MPVPTPSPSAVFASENYAEGPLIRSADAFEGQKLISDSMAPVATARTLFANYCMIQQDFPQLRDEAIVEACPGLRPLDESVRREAIEELIDSWLARHAGLMSDQQLGQELVNTAIRTKDERIPVWRPPRYGRAAVTEVGDINQEQTIGLLDLKGVGIAPGKEPQHRSHWDGLFGLSEALEELVFEGLVGAVFRNAGSLFRSLPSYGVVDLGFQQKLNKGRRELEKRDQQRAVVLVRRAHTRPAITWGKDPGPQIARLMLDTELLLRTYGVTACNHGTSLTLRENADSFSVTWGRTKLKFEPQDLERIRASTRFEGGRLTVDGVNIQFTSEIDDQPRRPQIVDFGGFESCEGPFANPVFSSSLAKHWRMQGEMIHPDAPEFAQPAFAASDREAPKRLGLLLVREYSNGRIGGREVQRRIEQFVEREIARFA